MQIQVPESKYRSISEHGEERGTADHAKPSMWPTNMEGANSNILTLQLLSSVKADVARDILWIPLSLRTKSRLIVQTAYSLSSLAFLTTDPITTFIPCSSSFSQDALNGAIPPIWSVVIALRRRASCSRCIVDHCCSVFREVPSRTAGGTTDKDACWVCIPLFQGINSKSTPPTHRSATDSNRTNSDTSKSIPLITGTCSSGTSRTSTSRTDSGPYYGSTAALGAAAWMGLLWKLVHTG